MENKSKFIRVRSSMYRNSLIVQDLTAKEVEGNAYGEILSVDKQGKQIPVICGHGGSMWLCRSCANKIMQEEVEK